MRQTIMLGWVLLGLGFGGCATWEGFKSDTRDAAQWSKDRVHQGADYVKQKTE